MKLKTPLMLITGSLGSGKTTLLRRILETCDLRLAVLMNEFGQIAIDSKVILGENVNILELADGCVCCSLTGEFEAAVIEILDKYHPQCIVLEATGVAEADALVYEVEDNLPQVRLDVVICIVDAYVSARHPHVGHISRTQLQAADLILINKIDLLTTEEVHNVEAQVRQHNKTAVFIKTVGCDVNVPFLFGFHMDRRSIPVNHHRDALFQTFFFTSRKLLDRDKFLKIISDLPTTVYRAKGFVRFDHGSELFNYVVGRADLEEFPGETTELVFIGRKLDEFQRTIESRLRDCEV